MSGNSADIRLYRFNCYFCIRIRDISETKNGKGFINCHFMKSMKRLTLSAAMLLCILAAVSCNDGIRFEEYGFSGSIALQEGRTDSLSIDIRMEYPEANTAAPAKDRISGTISATAFGEEYRGIGPQEAVDTYVADYISTYRTENLELAESLAGEGSMALSWGKYLTGVFSEEMNVITAGTEGVRLINYTITDYSYTGGAHGMNTETCLVFNTKTGKQVLLEDIFATDGMAALPALLMKHVPEAFGNPSDADYLLVTEIPVTENFSMSDSGITFIYNPYEIAAYAAGTIRITIPWEELQDICR